jgi:hypothetical protein
MLIPQWVRRVPSDEKLDKRFFATLSREGDLEVHNRVAKLLNQTKTKMSKEEMTQEDKDYLWTLMPQWVRRVPSDEKLDKTFFATLSREGFFATLSREGDLKVHNRVAKLLNQNKDG